jgi:hypothetical protein
MGICPGKKNPHLRRAHKALADMPVVVRQATNMLVTRDLAVHSLLQVAIGIAKLILHAK